MSLLKTLDAIYICIYKYNNYFYWVMQRLFSNSSSLESDEHLDNTWKITDVYLQ